MSARKKRYCQYSRCGKLITRAIGGKDSGKYCDKPCYFAAIDAGHAIQQKETCLAVNCDLCCNN
jgi:hypothetical protein